MQPNKPPHPEIKFTVGAEIEFYLLSPHGDIIADLASGKFPQKKYKILDNYQPNLKQFKDALKGYEVAEESGPGQFEVIFPPCESAVELAKKVNDFKNIAPEIAVKCGLLLNFAAKPLKGHPGNSLHIHYSSPLFDPYGLVANKGIFTAKSDANNNYVLWALGGMMAKVREDLNVYLPTEESKQRIEPYLNAPTKICWGLNNRSVMLRIPDGKPKRIEHRLAGADANPITVIGAVINAAEYGIKNKCEPDELVYGNAWDAVYEREAILP